MAKKVRLWTDEDLKTAVAASRSFREVTRRLGLQNGTAAHVTNEIRRLRIDTSHFELAPRAKKYLCSDDELRRLVKTCRGTTDILRALGEELRTNTYFKLKRHIFELGLETSHFSRDGLGRERRRRWSDDELRSAVAASFGCAEAIRKLGLIAAGGNYEVVKRNIRELELDTSHFRGQGWNADGKHFSHTPEPIEQLLVAGRYVSTIHLKRRLIREGLKAERCELCGWAQRSPDGRIPVELDHINGERSDNRLENLRVLCPNCHSLQPTHRGMNRKRGTSRASEPCLQSQQHQRKYLFGEVLELVRQGVLKTPCPKGHAGSSPAFPTIETRYRCWSARSV